MNIQEAKEQIKNAMTAYFTKDEFGRYAVRPEKQRPVFLMGPPGIGKTAVMEQIAQELDVALVSYSMTHHTRQSALGLPFIEKKVFDGKEYQVSEYTMSEIIAAIYETMEESGKREGILFLDEINCVSETLAPSMLQFLQYKIFGRHRVPDGWIVVTAGNPPEYNKSVREFDIVTWDRLKRIDVEPDFDAWKSFALQKGVHPAVLTYLEIRKGDFYKVESTVSGKQFVTARGWDDLSQMLHLYEKNGLPVDEKLVGQYLQNPRIAKEFAIYYDLFNKYRSDYQVDKILAGKAPAAVKKRAKAAKFDERLSLLGLLLDAAVRPLRAVAETEDALRLLLEALRAVKAGMASPDADIQALLDAQLSAQQSLLDSARRAGSLSQEQERARERTMAALRRHKQLAAKAPDDPFAAVKADFDGAVADMKRRAEAAGAQLTHLFAFCEEVFGDGQEMLILVTELTMDPSAARFISRYGCEAYFAHNKELLFYERQREILSQLDQLELP
ncbi:ATP-binding protein [Dysosmobacter sp.]|uniref:ATP-binding protein n=1 Tax=Dysosmobacter sp. TaxID=2591382 RepID=UPI002A972961|nr:MoxR family ATPase [Dysosmobacter sp.]MCI6054354.1 MoxR family ATPase [Dysosmobacter sp.]MDY5510030.1 MoxR family ATPase [Dysosmobacter sp.]